MKIPEKAPITEAGALLKLSKDKFRKIILPDLELKALLEKANVDYVYWDKFKYLKLPEGLNAEEAWMALKNYRKPFRRNISFDDNEGKPFHYFITPAMQSILSKIDQYAAGTLKLSDSALIKDGRDERFIVSSLMEEAIASSQIEGAATTRPVAKQLLRGEKKPVNKDQQMIANNYQTIVSIRESWRHEPLSPELIHKIHRSMTRGTLKKSEDEGRYRSLQDDQEGLAVWSDDGTLLHQPPSANKVPQLIEDLCSFANKNHEDEDFIHPVAKAIILHFWLAYIHPYIDGNGRTARALFYWYMLSRNYWLFEYLSISRIINNQRTQYLKAFLYTESDDADLNYFMMNQLRAVLQAIEDVKAYIQRKKEEDRQSRELLRGNSGLNDRQRSILFHAIQNPDAVFTVKSHRTETNTVYQTARTDLLQLVKLGFLEQQTHGKEFVFFPVKNLPQKIK